MSDVLSPQQLVERAVAAGGSDRTVAIVDETSTVNLRWAANSLTTNGATTSRTLTVAAIAPGADGPALGVVAGAASGADEVDALVAAARDAAAAAGPAPDAADLLDTVSGDWEAPARRTGVAALAAVAPGLGEVLARAEADGVGLYGYAEHQVRSTWAGSTAGLRVRLDAPEGHVTVTARTQVDGEPVRTSWSGRELGDPTDLDADALYAELRRRLGWSARRVELPAGRYDTVLPPDAVADLLVYLYWSAGGRDAADGSSAFAGGGGPAGTRIGERVVDPRVTLSSDPAGDGFGRLAGADRLVCRSSGADESVFDTGSVLARTDWVRDGRLDALFTSRASAAATGIGFSPALDTLSCRVHDGAGSAVDLVRDVDRGLLLTCLWYIREVDPRTLLLTGLTRDGVYLIEGGEIVGEVNNFRFNESPLGMLGRFTAAGDTVPALSREWGEYFPRTAMPALRVPDFRMSSVSQAT